MMSLISGGSSIGGGEIVLAGTERICYGWDHYIADILSLQGSHKEALRSQPIRAQYLDESGPMRVFHSDDWRDSV